MGEYLGTKRTKAAGQVPQDEHLASANAKKTMSGLLVPGQVIATDVSAAGVKVGKGNICRIRVTAATFIAFGESDIGAVSVTTDPAIELNDAGTYLVVATADYIRGSAAVARLEVITG